MNYELSALQEHASGKLFRDLPFQIFSKQYHKKSLSQNVYFCFPKSQFLYLEQKVWNMQLRPAIRDHIRINICCQNRYKIILSLKFFNFWFEIRQLRKLRLFISTQHAQSPQMINQCHICLVNHLEP